MAWTRSLLLLVAAGCTTYGPPAAPVQPPCRPITVRVVDEAGRPVAGASVRTIATYRQFGPSGLPEGSHMETDAIPSERTPMMMMTGSEFEPDPAAARANLGLEVGWR